MLFFVPPLQSLVACSSLSKGWHPLRLPRFCISESTDIVEFRKPFLEDTFIEQILQLLKSFHPHSLMLPKPYV